MPFLSLTIPLNSGTMDGSVCFSAAIQMYDTFIFIYADRLFQIYGLGVPRLLFALSKTSNKYRKIAFFSHSFLTT